MKRFLHIDFLRAIAILAVIVIHVFSDNLVSPLTFFIWNYLHFIIVAFVFCSGYVMYAFYAPKLTNVSTVLLWYKKRLIRLLLPFYWYLLIHYSLMLLFPAFFSGLGLQFSWNFIIQSVTLVGGISLNWLPLLFLQLAVVFPILVVLFKKKRVLFWSYVGLALLTTVGFTIWQFPYSQYRSVMWIPWSLFLVLPWYFFEKESSVAKAMDDKQNRQNYLPYFSISASSLIVFICLFILWKYVGRSVTLIDNKYPPNLFYISFEVFGSFLILGVGMWHFLQKAWRVLFYQFVSKVSYSLFFIHYIVMDFTLSAQKTFHIHISVWWQVCFVVWISLLIAYILHTAQNKLSTHIRWLS